MGWLKFAAVVGVVWGTTSRAALPDASGGKRPELQTISSWMERLNVSYPDVDRILHDFPEIRISTSEDLWDSNLREETITELKLLLEVLRGQITLPAGSLKLITCSNIVCGGR